MSRSDDYSIQRQETHRHKASQEMHVAALVYVQITSYVQLMAMWAVNVGRAQRCNACLVQ